MIKVFLADDHTVVRDGLRFMLGSQNDIQVIGGAATGRQAVKKVLELQPDVVIMDISMPDSGGIEATRQIVEAQPGIGVIILSMLGTTEHVYQALRAGAVGYLLKESAGQEVMDAVRAVYAGNRYFSKAIMDLLVEDYLQEKENETAHSPLDSLSMREREILQLVVEGKSSTEIAEKLFLSPKTVDTYRSRVMQKLEIYDLPGLVKFAIKQGLIPLD